MLLDRSNKDFVQNKFAFGSGRSTNGEKRTEKGLKCRSLQSNHDFRLNLNEDIGSVLIRTFKNIVTSRCRINKLLTRKRLGEKLKFIWTFFESRVKAFLATLCALSSEISNNSASEIVLCYFLFESITKGRCQHFNWLLKVTCMSPWVS